MSAVEVATQTERRRMILDKARQLFVQLGFEKTTVDRIAKETGIGKGSVYLEFSSKEALLQELIWQFYDQQLVQMEQVAAKAVHSFLNTLQVLVVEHLLTLYDQVTLTPLDNPLCDLSRLSVAEYQQYHTRLENIMGVLLKKATLNSEILPQTHYEQLSHLLMLSLSWAYPPYPEPINRDTLKKHASQMLMLMLHGLKIQP